MNAKEKLVALRQKMDQMGLSAVILPTGDPHCSEYTAARFQTRAWFTEFTGSMGTAVITHFKAALWVDGRYIVQAKEQTRAAGYEVFLEGAAETPSIEEFLRDELPQGGKVAVNGAQITMAYGQELIAKLARHRITLLTDVNMADQIRPGVPEMPTSRIWELEEEYAGSSAEDKLILVRGEMSRVGATHYVISSLDDIAWLTNLRGDDIPYFPVNYAYLIVEPIGARLFVDMKKMTTGIGSFLAKNGISVEEYRGFYTALEQLPPYTVVAMDPKRNTLATREHIRMPVVEISEFTRPMKCVKNAAEVEHMKKAGLVDGAAMVRFLMKFQYRLMQGNALKEGDMAGMLTQERKQYPRYVEESFATIAAYGPHGAMVHYVPPEGGGSLLEPQGLMVLDSGAHYLDGTTDITRTLSLGEPTEQEKRDYTLVLKSHIALAGCVFLDGETGSNLDVLARRIIWDEGMNYRHGTGHGVGYLLHVHEDPCRFWPSQESCVLKPGMILSVEPGIYREGVHGIRIENLVLVEEAFTNEYGRFLKLSPLTWCPIDTSCLDLSLMTEKELQWLNDYHMQVCENLDPYLSAEECEWLYEACQPIGSAAIRKGRRE